ncbi:alcohol acetyltransferase [Mycena crocata]|nr:alcohol acetyltransferase [Mycena crocata]
MASPSRLRRIGLMERFHVTRHFLGLDSCVVAAAQYTAQDGSILNAETLFPALRTLIETQAGLGVRVEGKETSGNVFFVRLPTVDLSRVVQFSPDKHDLQAAFESQLARGFETQTDLPLWRVEVLADNVIVFAVHHAVGDGMSSVAFHLNLFRALQSGHQSDATPSVPVPTTTIFLPAVDHATSVRPSLPLIFSELYTLVAPVAWTSMRSAWSGPVPTTPNLKTHIRLATFSALDVEAFLGTCRVHGATLTSAVYGLTVCVLARLLADDPARYKRVAALVALSLRGVAGVPDDVICDYPSSYHLTSPLTPNFSWEEAARFAGELREQKTKGREIIGMMHFLLGQFAPYFKGQIGAKRTSGFCVSNLGRLPKIPVVEGRWTIGDTVFAQCDVVTGSAFSINITGDPTGAMNVAFCWGETSVGTDFMEAFIKLFREEFQRVVIQ